MSVGGSTAGAVGIFDSGLGGMSVMRAVRALLPGLDLVYVADTAYAPYGDRSPESIVERTLHIGGWLERSGATALTVACNTATAMAVSELRNASRLPVVAIEPAIKPAVALSRSGVIGLLATSRTVRSERVARLCALHGGTARILLQPCPGLAERVDAADLDGAVTRSLVRQYVEPLLEQGADTLVLGCTHYPFLAERIREVAGEDVVLLDPAEAVARELARRMGLEPGAAVRRNGVVRFLVSGNADESRAVIRQLWPEAAPVESFPAG